MREVTLYTSMYLFAMLHEARWILTMWTIIYTLLIIRVKIVILKIVSDKEKMPFHTIFSSPEHEVLRVSYCDSAVSVVRRHLFALCTL